MNFNWMRFCGAYGIAFVERGANVASGNINIQCPFCSDPSEHLGLSLDEARPSWGCWRCKEAGKNPYWLVLALLKDKSAAMAALKEQSSDSPDDFDTLLSQPRAAQQSTHRATKKLPSTVRQLVRDSGASSEFLGYLKDRGFRNPLKLAKAYDLHYSISGEYAHRILLPVRMDGQLISWVGRTIRNATVRYKTENSGDLKRCIANWDSLQETPNPEDTALLISEGPVDFLKLDSLLSKFQCRATCTFGTAWTETQALLLAKQCKRFAVSFVVYDAAAEGEAMELSGVLSELAHREVFSASVPGVDDPGDMTANHVRPFLDKLERRLSTAKTET